MKSKKNPNTKVEFLKKKKRLKMYSEKPKRDRKGRIINQKFSSKIPTEDGRIQPDRRFFENTRTINQKSLNEFRETIKKQVENDPFSVLLKRKKLPIQLLTESDIQGENKPKLLKVSPFEKVFGDKQLSIKHSNIQDTTLIKLLENAKEEEINYNSNLDIDANPEGREEQRFLVDKPVFQKGQSKRIWNELYKVLDSSDVIIEVIDARDPLGTRSKYVENYLINKAKHKQLILLLNKCDLVPINITRGWIKYLSKELPTLAFHASLTKPFGKGMLIKLLQQFKKLHPDKPQISVGFIGFPNVGKSSVINSLRSKKVCNVAPIPGETKVWQYITLMKKIFLIDCPGIVHDIENESLSNIDKLLRGIVRVERAGDVNIDAVERIFSIVKHEYIEKTYGISNWNDHIDFINKLSMKMGRLSNGGKPNKLATSMIIVRDFLRGKLPYFNEPPEID